MTINEYDDFAADDYYYEDEDPFYSSEYDEWDDVSADADTLVSVGWGTDEDYGMFFDDSDVAWDCDGNW